MRARVLLGMAIGLVLISAGFAFYLNSTATGTLAIQVRDAPASWAAVTVTFSEVRAYPAGAGNGSGWIRLNLTETRIDFLALGNLTKLLALNRLAPGMYTQIRIVVSSVVGLLPSGSPVAMTVPDGILKTTTPFAIRGGGTTTVTIDLDLAKSIVQSNGQWIFSPVLGQVSVS